MCYSPPKVESEMHGQGRNHLQLYYDMQIKKLCTIYSPAKIAVDCTGRVKENCLNTWLQMNMFTTHLLKLRVYCKGRIEVIWLFQSKYTNYMQTKQLCLLTRYSRECMDCMGRVEKKLFGYFNNYYYRLHTNKATVHGSLNYLLKLKAAE